MCIAFDFDGVIADSMPAQAEAWTSAAAQCGQDPTPLLLNLYRGHAGPRMFEDLDISKERARCLREAKDSLWREKQGGVSLFAGAVEGIERIARFARLGIASTASAKYINAVLSRGNVARHFTAIVTDADAPAPKPDPALLRVIASELDCHHGDLWMVGDTETDRLMSGRAGSRFVAFAPDGQPRQGLSTDGVPMVRTWAALTKFFESRSGE